MNDTDSVTPFFVKCVSLFVRFAQVFTLNGININQILNFVKIFSKLLIYS